MNAEKFTFLGLGIIVVAVAILPVGYWAIWDREFFWQTPLFNSSSSFTEAGAIFDDYEKERAKIVEEFAELHKRNEADTVKAGTSQNRDELFAIWARRSWVPNLPGVKALSLEQIQDVAFVSLKQELEGLMKSNEGQNRALVEKYRTILREKAHADLHRQRSQQAWAPSIVSSVMVLLLASAVAYFGLRLLRRGGMPGTVFDEPPQK